MRRYTTPTVTVEVEGVDLTTSTVLVTFQQRSIATSASLAFELVYVIA